MKKIFLLFLILNLSFQSQKLKSQNCSNVPISLIAQYQTTNPALPQTVIADRLNRPYLYLAAKDAGLMIFNISTITSPALIQTLNISLFDSLHVMNAFQEGNYLYLALGNFFGTAPQNPGIAIIDISNPSNPVVTDVWKYPSVQKGSAVITVQGNYAYLGAMNKGLMILDISNKNNILFVSEYLPDPNYPVNNPSASQMPNARGMAISGNNLFLCYDAGGLRVINITDKNNPIQIARYLNAGMSKQQAYNNIALNGTVAYIAVDYCGMEIVDISNLNNITELSWWNPYNCQASSNTWFNSPGHMNQLVYVPSDNAVFLSAGGSQLRVIDVSNPALPDSCNGYGLTATQQGTWGLDVYNKKIYLANVTSFFPFYSTWAGIKILDWPSALNIHENLYLTENLSIQPNPFTSSTEIHFRSEQASAVKIIISDIAGRVIKVITKDKSDAGEQIISWNGSNNSEEQISDGMYFLKIEMENKLITGKLLKVK